MPNRDGSRHNRECAISPCTQSHRCCHGNIDRPRRRFKATDRRSPRAMAMPRHRVRPSPKSPLRGLNLRFGGRAALRRYARRRRGSADRSPRTNIASSAAHDPAGHEQPVQVIPGAEVHGALPPAAWTLSGHPIVEYHDTNVVFLCPPPVPSFLEKDKGLLRKRQRTVPRRSCGIGRRRARSGRYRQYGKTSARRRRRSPSRSI